jgi:citrate synthase
LINIDDSTLDPHNGSVSTLIRSGEAAALLNVSKPTLYAYVSRGRLQRTTAPDGRTSLFARDEVERLAERSRRAAPGQRATIDVQISSAVTVIDDSDLRYRGVRVTDLAATGHFEDVAELLWTQSLSSEPKGVRWPALSTEDRDAIRPIADLTATPIGRIAIAAHVLGASHLDDSPADAARRLLLATPTVLGSTRRTGRFADRVARAWRARPTRELVDAVDAALILLADHELATSTLAVRIAASVRTSPYVAFAAGLASMEGTLHGSASAEVHHFLIDCAEAYPATVIARRRARREPIPGFGHKVYRTVDPRFGPLLEQVRRLDPDGATLVDAVVAEAGRVLPHPPNVDLALGALTWATGLDPATPIFAVARIAGWGAHYDEELNERPVRFRGVATPR